LENPQAAIKAAMTVADAAIAVTFRYKNFKNNFKNGIYFIIDWHDVANQKCTNDEEFKKFTNSAITFFTTILSKYKGSPNLLLELWNEPICPWNKLKEYYNAVLAVSLSGHKYRSKIVFKMWLING